MSNKRYPFQIQFFEKFGEVITEGVVVLSIPGLARSAMSPTVMSNHAKALLAQE